MGTRTVSAFRPSDQTRGAIANSALITSSGSTVVATGRGNLHDLLSHFEAQYSALDDDASVSSALRSIIDTMAVISSSIWRI